MGEVKKQGMESLFVPYDIALALKELGFDEPCIATIDQIEYLHIKGTKKQPRGSMMYDTIDAPLYQQAFRWFREKYGLEIVFRPDSFNDESKKLREYVIISYDKTWKLEEILEPSHWIRKGCFKTYEEAELECLKKLIELCKKN